MKRVLMLTQCLDESNWLVGFIPQWVDALAAEVDVLYVITLELGTYRPPANVHVYSMGKEQGRGKLGILRGFYQALLAVIDKVDAVFVHMIPRYGVLAAPLTWLKGKPMTLWYTHPNIDPELRLATAFSRRIVTAGPGSFPIDTPKLRVLGHGIDTNVFSPGQDKLGEPPVIVQVGRIMPVKNHAAVIRALAMIASDTNAELVIIGGLPKGAEADYPETLRTLADELQIADRVKFTGALSMLEVRDWYRRAAVAVNVTRVGSFDKAALESMATGTPTLVAQSAFDALLGAYTIQLRIEAPDDIEGLAARLGTLLALSHQERLRMTDHIRQRVIEAHSLQNLAAHLTNVLLKGEL